MSNGAKSFTDNPILCGMLIIMLLLLLLLLFSSHFPPILHFQAHISGETFWKDRLTQRRVEH